MPPETPSVWSIRDARARLSEVVRRSRTEGPQQIAIRGKVSAVVLSKGEYDRLIGLKPSLVDLIRNSPLAGLDLDIRRDKSPARKVTLLNEVLRAVGARLQEP